MADFLWKVGLKILNKADYNSFSDLFSEYLKPIDHLNLKLLIFCRHTTSFKTLIFKFRILEILNFHPCYYSFSELFSVHLRTIGERSGSVGRALDWGSKGC